MNSRAVVVSTENNEITVLPLLKNACASCTSGCEKQGASFTVDNPLKLPVSKGTVVILSLSKKILAIQGIVSLLFPFLCAVGGYFFGSWLSAKAGFSNAEGAKALCVLAFLAVSCTAVYLVSRHYPFKGKSEIIDIY